MTLNISEMLYCPLQLKRKRHFILQSLQLLYNYELSSFHVCVCFGRHIEASLSSLSTQINFFIHNLAQYKFSTPTTSHGLLSFSPSSYSYVIWPIIMIIQYIMFMMWFHSIFTDGKIASAVVVAYHLRYFPEKYIVSNCILFPFWLCELCHCIKPINRVYHKHHTVIILLCVCVCVTLGVSNTSPSSRRL